MAVQMAGMMAYLLAGVAGAAAVVFWRKTTKLRGESAGFRQHNGVLQQQLGALEAQLQELKSQNGDTNKKLLKAEKDLEGWRQRWDQFKGEEEAKRSGLSQQLRKLEDQLEHFQAQATALTAQLQEVDQEKRELRLGWEKKLEESRQQFQQERKDLATSLADAKRQLRALESKGQQKDEELKEVHQRLEEVDPAALKKAKTRLHQYHHLYQIMRGHKEMAEERNRNWELALRLLANWILQEKGAVAMHHDSLGSLVAQALEAIKHGSLIDDEEEISLQRKALLSKDELAAPITTV